MTELFPPCFSVYIHVWGAHPVSEELHLGCLTEQILSSHRSHELKLHLLSSGRRRCSFCASAHSWWYLWSAMWLIGMGISLLCTSTSTWFGAAILWSLLGLLSVAVSTPWRHFSARHRFCSTVVSMFQVHRREVLVKNVILIGQVPRSLSLDSAACS